MQAETSGIASHWSGLKRDRFWQHERTRPRNQEFLHHGFSYRWSARAEADGLRKSRGIRFRKELALLRKHCEPFIGIVDARRYLPIRFIHICGDSLSRLGFVADAFRSRSDKFEGRCLRHAGN